MSSGSWARRAGPARRFVAASPHDVNEIEATRALYIGSGGDLKVTDSFDNDIVFENIAAGTMLDIEVKKVWLNGTTADAIVLLY